MATLDAADLLAIRAEIDASIAATTLPAITAAGDVGVADVLGWILEYAQGACNCVSLIDPSEVGSLTITPDVPANFNGVELSWIRRSRYNNSGASPYGTWDNVNGFVPEAAWPNTEENQLQCDVTMVSGGPAPCGWITLGFVSAYVGAQTVRLFIPRGPSSGSYSIIHWDSKTGIPFHGGDSFKVPFVQPRLGDDYPTSVTLDGSGRPSEVVKSSNASKKLVYTYTGANKVPDSVAEADV
jgi:hypothetical protein